MSACELIYTRDYSGRQGQEKAVRRLQGEPEVMDINQIRKFATDRPTLGVLNLASQLPWVDMHGYYKDAQDTAI